MIELQFSSRPGPASRLIEWFGGDLGWAHVDAVMPPWDPQAGWLLGARHDCPVGDPPAAGVQIRQPRYTNFSRTDRVRLEVSPAQSRSFYAGLRGQVGKPYSERNIIGFLIGRDLRDNSAWDCSSLQTFFLFVAGVLPTRVGDKARLVTPNALYLIALTASKLLRRRAILDANDRRDDA